MKRSFYWITTICFLAAAGPASADCTSGRELIDSAATAKKFLTYRPNVQASRDSMYRNQLWNSLSQAAELGNGEAFAQIGDLYERGWLVPQNRTTAAQYYEKAAGCRNAFAEYRLGVFYGAGVAYPQNWAEAAKWYRRGAQDGNADAASSVAMIDFRGRTGSRNIPEAIQMFQRASALGSDVDTYYARALEANPNLETVAALDGAATKVKIAESENVDTLFQRMTTMRIQCASNPKAYNCPAR